MHNVRTGSRMGAAAPAGAASPQRQRRNSLPGRLSPVKRPCRLELGTSRGEASGHGPDNHCSGDSSADPSMRGGSVWGGNVWGGSFVGRKHPLGSNEPSMRGGSVWKNPLGSNENLAAMGTSTTTPGVSGTSSPQHQRCFRKHPLGSSPASCNNLEGMGTTTTSTPAPAPLQSLPSSPQRQRRNSLPIRAEDAPIYGRRPSSGGNKARRRLSIPSELLSRGMHGLHGHGHTDVKRRQHETVPDVKKRQHIRQYSRPTIDLLPYCDRAPFTVHELLPLYMVRMAIVSVATVSVAIVSVAIVSVAIVSVAMVSTSCCRCTL